MTIASAVDIFDQIGIFVAHVQIKQILRGILSTASTVFEGSARTELVTFR